MNHLYAGLKLSLLLVILCCQRLAVADTLSQAKLREAREAKTEKALSGNVVVEAVKKRDLATYYQIIETLSPLSDNPKLLFIRFSAVNGAVVKLTAKQAKYADDADVIAYFAYELEILKNIRNLDQVWCGRVAKGVELPADLSMQLPQHNVAGKSGVVAKIIEADPSRSPKSVNAMVVQKELGKAFTAMEQKYGQDLLNLTDGAYTTQELKRWCGYSIELAEKIHATPDAQKAMIYRYFFDQMIQTRSN